MGTSRLEAFSDGVIAIIITIMVLNLKVPANAELKSLRPLFPYFASYISSFIYVGIYWNNHHHLFQAAKTVNGPVLWANLFLLFWLSLIPFVTNWVSLNHFARLPVIAYGLLLSINSFAYFLLAKLLIHHNGKESLLGKAIQNDFKGRFTLGCYAFSIMVSFYWSEAGFILYCLIACIWFIPDKRIEAIYNGVDQDNESDKGS